MSPHTEVAPAAKKLKTDPTHLGEQAAHQPLSGVSIVPESLAVNGLGHGAYLRQEELEKKKA